MVLQAFAPLRNSVEKQMLALNATRVPFSVMDEYTGCRKPGIYEVYVTYATYLIYVILRSYPDNLSYHACPAQAPKQTTCFIDDFQ
jgi:hypothetical protein